MRLRGCYRRLEALYVSPSFCLAGFIQKKYEQSLPPNVYSPAKIALSVFVFNSSTL